MTGYPGLHSPWARRIMNAAHWSISPARWLARRLERRAARRWAKEQARKA